MFNSLYSKTQPQKQAITEKSIELNTTMNFYIKTPRQMRAVIELLGKPIKVSELGSRIGALNARQIVSELRQQGFLGIIFTRRFIVIDQDGKRCRPGEYYIPEHLKQMISESLKESAKPQARTLFWKRAESNRNSIRKGM
jgi:hypothetical protein